MLLIDASNLKSGGGAGLLIHLTDVLFAKGFPFVVLQNPALEKYGLKGKLINVSTTFFNRNKILKRHIDDLNPKSVFYFGNYPTGFRLKDKRTFVSFQNLHLLGNFDGTAFNWKENLGWALRRWFLKYNLENADEYIVPTTYVKDLFLNTFDIEDKRVPIIPFYEEQNMLKWKQKFLEHQVEKETNAFIYNSSPSPHKNHENLLTAWGILLEKGYKPHLKLTIPKDHRTKRFLNLVEDLIDKGAKITNINADGFLPYPEVLKHIYSCEFTIFPSLNETFGFGQVEGALMGNKVLSSKREHVKPVITPSAYFDPHNPMDIANCVSQAMDEELPMPILHFRDEINDLVNLLYKN